MTKFNDVCKYFAMKESGELLAEFMCIAHKRICSSMESLYTSVSVTAVRMYDGTVISYRKTDKTDKYGNAIWTIVFTDKSGRKCSYLYFGVQTLLEYDMTLEEIIDYEDYSNECIIESEIN